MVIDAYQQRSDDRTFEPILEKYNIMYDKYPKYPVADAGYGGYDNYRYCESKGMELYQKYKMWSKEKEPKFKKQIFNNFKNLNDYKKFIEPKKSFLSSIKVIYL